MQPVSLPRNFPHVRRIDHIGRQTTTRITVDSIRIDVIKLNHENVTRLSTFDVKRTGLGIPVHDDLRPGCVASRRVNGARYHGIARLDA